MHANTIRVLTNKQKSYNDFQTTKPSELLAFFSFTCFLFLYLQCFFSLLAFSPSSSCWLVPLAWFVALETSSGSDSCSSSSGSVTRILEVVTMVSRVASISSFVVSIVGAFVVRAGRSFGSLQWDLLQKHRSTTGSPLSYWKKG